MILVTLGTQDKPFNRILEMIQELIDEKVIDDEVIVQAGCTKFKSNDMKIFDLIPMEEFEELMKKCDMLITHGGVGSICSGLNNNKKVIAIARLAKFGEHVNDHQEQIIYNFNKEGYILGVSNKDELKEAILNKKFKPSKFKSNTNNMINLVEELINK